MDENFIEGPERGGCADGQCSIENAPANDSSEGPIEKATLKGLFSLMKKSDIFLNLGY